MDGSNPKDGDQEGSGKARNRARALLNWFCQGQPWGKCRVRRRAVRVMRLGREKKRRRRVLVVATGSPKPRRVVQRAKLCAMICIASQAALAGKRPMAGGHDGGGCRIRCPPARPVDWWLQRSAFG